MRGERCENTMLTNRHVTILRAGPADDDNRGERAITLRQAQGAGECDITIADTELLVAVVGCRGGFRVRVCCQCAHVQLKDLASLVKFTIQSATGQKFCFIARSGG